MGNLKVILPLDQNLDVLMTGFIIEEKKRKEKKRRKQS